MTDAPEEGRRRRVVRRWTVPALLAVAVALAVGRPVALRTSFDDLVGDGVEAVPASVRQASSDLVPVLLWSPSDPSAAVAAARTLRAELPADLLAEAPEDPFAALAADRWGLAAPADVRLLETSEGRARLARRALRRYVASPLPPLFPVAEDPFALADGFVRAQRETRANWSLRDGQLVARGADGVDYVVLLLRLRPSVVADTDALIAFRDRLDAARAAVAAAHPSVRTAACGVPLHTAATAGNCKREINALSVLSLVFIALLSVFAFRSVRWIPLLAASLAVAGLAGGVALLLFFREIHLMTVVLGTTVMGLVIDYSFHWLLADARRGFVRNLVISWLTTEISLLPLMLASLPVLRQSAVFLGTGLAAALAYVVWGYPRGWKVERWKSGKGERGEGVKAKSLRLSFVRCPLSSLLRPLASVLRPLSSLLPPPTFPPSHFPTSTLLLLLLSAFAVLGLCRVRFGTNLTALYRPPADLAAAERFFAGLGGSDEGDRGFLVLDRRMVAANVEKLFDEQGERQRVELGLPELRRPVCAGAETAALAAMPRPKEALPSGVRFLQPRTVLAAVLSRWTNETLVRLGCALALMFVALVLFDRRRAIRLFLPSALAIAVVAGALGLRGEPMNLFHLLACFLLAGMSVDYTVFLHGGGRAAWKPALCSLLTSVVGFGALAFVSFPVVQGFGFVLGVGLPCGFFAAWATRRDGGTAASPAARTAEVAATPLGLEILWTLYRLLGLRALHLFAASVGLCAWTCSRKVRRATGVRKLVNFTRALSDKLVVMADGRDRPRVETDGSADAAAFLDDVRAGRGVFVLSSHVGTVEVLTALGACDRTFHAWMDIDRTGVFNRFYLRHANRAKVVIHPIADVEMATAFFAGEALDRGDCLVMAGDRGRGAFRFAHAMEHSVYFVACVWTGRAYRAVIRRLPDETRAMASAYDAVLHELASAYPDQWFVWNSAPSANAE